MRIVPDTAVVHASLPIPLAKAGGIAVKGVVRRGAARAGARRTGDSRRCRIRSLIAEPVGHGSQYVTVVVDQQERAQLFHDVTLRSLALR